MADGNEGGQAATYTREQVDQEVAGLKAKNSELLEKLTRVNSTLEKLKAFEGLDPEKVKAALKTQEQLEVEKQKAAGDWEAREKALREQFASEHEKVVKPLQERLSTLENQYFEAVAVREAVEAMGRDDIKGKPPLLLPVLRPELGVEMIDGKPVVVVKGPDGKPRVNPTTNERITVTDRLKELRSNRDFAGAFSGAGTSGSGAEGGSGGSGDGARIPLRDEKAFLANLDKIAKGEVKVEV